MENLTIPRSSNCNGGDSFFLNSHEIYISQLKLCPRQKSTYIMTRGRWLNELIINQLHRIKNISIKSYKKNMHARGRMRIQRK